MIKFGPARDEDLDLIHAIIISAIESTAEYTDEAKKNEFGIITPELIQEAISEGLCFVAREDTFGRLAGVCFGEEDCGIVWLSWIVVRSEYHRQGIGVKLLREFVRIMFSDDRFGKTHKVWCSVLTSNEASNSLMRKAGFEKTVTLQKHWYGLDYNFWQNTKKDS